MTEFETSVMEQLQTVQAQNEELLTVLGNIQGYLLFFIVALLLWAVYKFFRMFF